MRVVFVHGACVRDGAWWWRRTAAVLADHGVGSVAPLLPSCGEGPRPAGSGSGGFADDVASVRRVLLGADEPTVVVAHSYGGIVTAQAAVGVEAVRRLVLVSSYLPEPGESLSTFGAEEPAPFLAVDVEAGTLAVRPELFVDTFLHDCPDDASGARERLVAQSLSVVAAPVAASAWHDIPSTYLVCAADRGTPASRQRAFAERADVVVEIDSGHHPFLAQPQRTAELVLQAAR